MRRVDVENYSEFSRWVKGKSDETERKYERVLRKYCEFRGMDPEELIDEAEDDWNSSRREKGEVESRIKDFQEHMEEGGYSGVSVKNNILCLKSFYSANNFPQNVSAPRASPTSKALKIRSDDVRKLVSVASVRDKAITLMMFQSGIDVSTICSLDYSHVKKGLEADEEPMPIEVQRPKEKVNYTTFVLQDTMEALRDYLRHREEKPTEWDGSNVPIERAGEPDLGDPLFVKERSRGDSDRLSPAVIQKMMRKVAIESGLVSREEMENSKMNPCRPHALRKGFSSVLELNGINSNIVNGFLGHSVDYDSAYSQQAEEELADQYMEAEGDLRITGSRGETEERIDDLHAKLGERDERMDGLEEELESWKDRWTDERRERKALEEKVDGLNGELRELYREQIFSLIGTLKEAGIGYSELKEISKSEEERRAISAIERGEDSISASLKESSWLHGKNIGDEEFWHGLLKTQVMNIKIHELSKMSPSQLKGFRDRLRFHKKFLEFESMLEMTDEESEKFEEELLEIARSLEEELAEEGKTEG
ncbi:hypothetical protein AKJ66_00115 [candidate division MSBL1 archaeon SCGC-AAA259E22]|uniref:Tyr recombinase domain-containing protein n=1 Tax=candidate division MSBL1 archaeon SCGC-AAA259E22 TaxID=1698265 RepID=A0A133UIK3_9EURY|nr:hypothetical protein AKJ66_00115 [candidate division MSBL1 archaeon SCGC-AAA259E22]